MPEEVVNKIAASGLLTLDLSDYLPKEIVEFDVKDFLFMQMILKEKDFRDKLKSVDWNDFTGRDVTVFCSTDAIIPAWAYMLIGTYLQPVAASFNFGTRGATEEKLLLNKIAAINIGQFKDRRIITRSRIPSSRLVFPDPVMP